MDYLSKPESESDFAKRIASAEEDKEKGVRDHKTWFEKQQKKIEDKFDKKEDAVKRSKLIEQLVNAAGKWGAAAYGKSVGVDASKIELEKTDFEKQLDRLEDRRTEELKSATDMAKPGTDKSKIGTFQRTKFESEDGEPLTFNSTTGQHMLNGEIYKGKKIRSFQQTGKDPEGTTKYVRSGENVFKSDESGNYYKSLAPNDRKRVSKAREDFRKDTEKHRAAIRDSYGIDGLIRAGGKNEISAGMIGAVTASMIEGNVKLTDSDVERYVKRNSIISRVEDILSKVVQGTLSEGLQKELLEAMAEYKKSQEASMNTAAQEIGQDMAGFGLDAQKVSKTIYSKYSPVTEKKEKKSTESTDLTPEELKELEELEAAEKEGSL